MSSQLCCVGCRLPLHVFRDFPALQPCWLSPGDVQNFWASLSSVLVFPFFTASPPVWLVVSMLRGIFGSHFDFFCTLLSVWVVSMFGLGGFFSPTFTLHPLCLSPGLGDGVSACSHFLQSVWIVMSKLSWHLSHCLPSVPLSVSLVGGNGCSRPFAYPNIFLIL